MRPVTTGPGLSLNVGVVDHDAVEHSVEPLGVDAVGSLDFAVEPRCGGSEVFELR